MKQFAAAIIVAIASAQTGKISIDSASRSIVDETGRQILFHGINAVYKMAPYIPTIDGAWTPQDSLNA
jgi:hypothetical protein